METVAQTCGANAIVGLGDDIDIVDAVDPVVVSFCESARFANARTKMHAITTAFILTTVSVIFLLDKKLTRTNRQDAQVCDT